MRAAAALAGLVLLSCYPSEVPSGKYSCETDGDCPLPLVCQATPGKGKRCVEAGTGPEAPAGPCSEAGTQLVPTVWACRGNFASGAAASLCRDGSYRLCGAADAAVLGTLGPVCTAAGGFYATEVPIERVQVDTDTTSYTIDCEIRMGADMPWGLLGCGLEPGAAAISQRTTANCPALPVALRCDRTADWTCNRDGRLANVEHKNAAVSGGGVLCCKK